MNKIYYASQLSMRKLKYIKNIPLNRREKHKNIYMHDFSNEEYNELISYFPNINNSKTNDKFGHDYIFNSLYEFDLILINNYNKIIDIYFIQSCLEILDIKGEIWIFIHKTNDILNGDDNTKILEDILHENQIRFYKNKIFDQEYPLDILIIHKNKNKKFV